MVHRKDQSPRTWRCFRGYFNRDGGVAAEFALVAPTIILIAAGIADFGMLAMKSAALEGTTQIGAQYAMIHPADTQGIQSIMQNSMGFIPALSFPARFHQSCSCDDRTPINCAESCAAVGRPGPNRVSITISASQAFTPLAPWPGIPATLTATTEIRLQ